MALVHALNMVLDRKQKACSTVELINARGPDIQF